MDSQLYEAQLQPQAEWRELKAGETFLLLLEKRQWRYPRGLKEQDWTSTRTGRFHLRKTKLERSGKISSWKGVNMGSKERDPIKLLLFSLSSPSSLLPSQFCLFEIPSPSSHCPLPIDKVNKRPHPKLCLFKLLSTTLSKHVFRQNRRERSSYFIFNISAIRRLIWEKGLNWMNESIPVPSHPGQSCFMPIPR